MESFLDKRRCLPLSEDCTIPSVNTEHELLSKLGENLRLPLNILHKTGHKKLTLRTSDLIEFLDVHYYRWKKLLEAYISEVIIRKSIIREFNGR